MAPVDGPLQSWLVPSGRRAGAALARLKREFDREGTRAWVSLNDA